MPDTETTAHDPSPGPARPASPCVKRCVLAACHALCTGCGRTRDEIAAWASMGEARRAEIMAGLPDRIRFLGIGALPLPAR